MLSPMKIVGIIGSLRKGSFNRGLMNAALTMVPDGATLEVAEINELPLFSQDIESPLPPAVKKFKDIVKAGDAILFATPEYNHSVPGVLKNAIDWLSRPDGDNTIDDKPIAIMGASTGMIGTARAQYHLRQCFIGINGLVMNKPEVFVTFAKEKFDAQGKLTDEKTKKKVEELLVALVAWTERLR
jgi:chromate reductase